MPVSPDGRRLTCVPVGRGDWTVRALDSWRPLLTAMTPAPGPAPPAPTAGAGDDRSSAATTRRGARRACSASGPPPSDRCSSACRSDRWSAICPIGRSGQYSLALPWAPSDELLLVTGQRRRVRRGLEPSRGGGAAVGVRPRAGLQLRAHPSVGPDPDGGAARRPGRVRRPPPSRTWPGASESSVRPGVEAPGHGPRVAAGDVRRSRGAARRPADPRDRAARPTSSPRWPWSSTPTPTTSPTWWGRSWSDRTPS